MARVAVVTGGASGIGEATARLLAQRGVAVAVFDVAGDDAVDVTDPEAVRQGVDRTRRGLGPVDIVVNCACVPSGGSITAENYLDSWERALAVNLTGAMIVVRACLDDLMRSAAGRIVNVASTEAISTWGAMA